MIQWRRPGDKIWFSWPRFIIEIVGDRVLMVSTAQGSRVLRFMHIDFEKDRVGSSIEIKAQSNTTISHFSCKNSQQKENRIECIVVGEGIMIETIIVDILVEKVKVDSQKDQFDDEVKLFHFNSVENTAKQLALRQQAAKQEDEASKKLVADIDK